MKILTIGDIFGRTGRNIVEEELDRIGGKYDFIIANAENASHGRGLSKPVYEQLSAVGIDVFTMGNHAWGCPDIETVMRYNDNVIRPANFEGDVPGSGSVIAAARNGLRVGVINLIGRTYLQSAASSPFFSADREIQRLKPKCDIILVDFHAEATSEKMALGYYLDGRVTAVFGTHTHVQTADSKILPKGTGYITDLGMTGPTVSVLGLDKQTIVNRFLNGMPQKFTVADGRGQFCGAEFEIDENSMKVTKITRIYKEY
ncbi:MAG: TIGR00282 family metallophosphoesterase [Clostridiales bacterium]|nr:TIGR00282 family metallophosphoesterase [Clostridiales bacterium]